MDDTTLQPVVETPDHAAALAMLTESTAVASAPAVVSAPAAADEAPKRKGGFPKGGKRDGSGRLVRDAAGHFVSTGDGGAPRRRRKSRASARAPVDPAPAAASNVYTAEVAGAAPLTGEVRDGPPVSSAAPASGFVAPGAPDPALVEYVRPRVDLLLRGVTLLLARLTKKPDALATDAERALMAEAISVELAVKAPELAEKAGQMGIAGAVLPYAIRLLGLYSPFPSDDVAASQPAPAAAPQPAAAPVAQPEPVAVVRSVPRGDMGYGGAPV